MGANFGAFTLYFLKNAGDRGKVVAFEPIQKNCDDILENVRLNKLDASRLTLLTMGLGKDHQKQLLTFDPANTSRASFDPAISNGIEAAGSSSREEIEIDSLDNVIARLSLPKPDFVKIDVEGLEYDVLLGMTGLIKKVKPGLLIEMHGETQELKKGNAVRVMEFLATAGYSAFHIEAKVKVTKENYAVAASGHLYCV